MKFAFSEMKYVDDSHGYYWLEDVVHSDYERLIKKLGYSDPVFPGLVHLVARVYTLCF